MSKELTNQKGNGDQTYRRNQQTQQPEGSKGFGFAQMKVVDTAHKTRASTKSNATNGSNIESLIMKPPLT